MISTLTYHPEKPEQEPTTRHTTSFSLPIKLPVSPTTTLRNLRARGHKIPAPTPLPRPFPPPDLANNFRPNLFGHYHRRCKLSSLHISTQHHEPPLPILRHLYIILQPHLKTAACPSPPSLPASSEANPPSPIHIATEHLRRRRLWRGHPPANPVVVQHRLGDPALHPHLSRAANFVPSPIFNPVLTPIVKPVIKPNVRNIIHLPTSRSDSEFKLGAHDDAAGKDVLCASRAQEDHVEDAS
jgi:hypothetical protein